VEWYNLKKSIKICSTQSGVLPSLKELYNSRELLLFFCWREIKIRYKQAYLGASWAILQPVIKMVIFSIIFGRLANISSDGVPYPIFSYLGVLPWTLFADSLSRAGNSMVTNGALLKKVYIPRLIIPLGAMLPALFDFLIASTVLVGMMMYYHDSIVIGWKLVLLPFVVLLALFVSFTVSLWISAINVKYRDVKFAIPFMIQMWMYASPVVYSASEVTGIWKWVYGLNPMAGVVQSFRWIFLKNSQGVDELLILSVLVTAVMFFFGIKYFTKTQQFVADIV